MPRSSSKKTAGALNQSKSKRRCRTQHHKQRHSCERDNCTARKFGSKHRNRRGSKKQEEMAAHGKYTALLQRSASMNRNKRAMQMQLQFPQREQMHELHDVPARHDCRMQVPLADHGSAAAARSSTRPLLRSSSTSRLAAKFLSNDALRAYRRPRSPPFSFCREKAPFSR